MTRYVVLIVNEHSAPEEVQHLCACEVDEVHVPVLKSTGHMIKLFSTAHACRTSSDLAPISNDEICCIVML